ncbi:hypothetical protein PM082_003723 [Marasmius tenuissimus]|nr:hypothetical protein PM082_003723 [Marasmius tenuissimus]
MQRNLGSPRFIELHSFDRRDNVTAGSFVQDSVLKLDRALERSEQNDVCKTPALPYLEPFIRLVFLRNIVAFSH